MTRLAQSLCLFSAGSADIWSAPADQEVNIILSWLTDLCLLDLMRKHISVHKNWKFSFTSLLPWTHFSVLAGVQPQVHGGQMFCKLSLNIVSQHPQSNLGPSHWLHHQQLQGPGDFRGRRRPGPEDGTSKPHRGWAEDDAMLRWGTAVDDGPIGGQSWLRWDGDLSNHSLDCGSNSEIWFSLWYEFKWKTKLLLQNH